jgi:hypothetical protein
MGSLLGLIGALLGAFGMAVVYGIRDTIQARKRVTVMAAAWGQKVEHAAHAVARTTPFTAGSMVSAQEEAQKHTETFAQAFVAATDAPLRTEILLLYGTRAEVDLFRTAEVAARSFIFAATGLGEMDYKAAREQFLNAQVDVVNALAERASWRSMFGEWYGALAGWWERQFG